MTRMNTTSPEPVVDPELAGRLFDEGQRVVKVFNGTYTIENPATGQHRTFRVKTQPKDANFAPGKRVLALLTGPDNESHYTGFAFVTDDGVQVWRSKQTALNLQYAKMLWSMVTEGDASPFALKGARLHLEGACCVCNRKLTHPKSIVSGIGPKCAGRRGRE